MSFYFSYEIVNLYDILEKNLLSSQLEKIYSKKKLHCTMFYSDEEYKKNYKTLKLPNHVSIIEAITIWNTGKDFVLVANLSRENLIEKHEKIKNEFNLVYSKQFNPHITIQRLPQENQLLKPEDFKFLIGEKIELSNFRCIPIKNKDLNNVPKILS